MPSAIQIAKAGLNRFYDEGYTRWSEEKLRVLFSNRSLQEPEIENTLEEWENAGWVELPKKTDEYLKMREIIPE